MWRRRYQTLRYSRISSCSLFQSQQTTTVMLSVLPLFIATATSSDATSSLSHLARRTRSTASWSSMTSQSPSQATMTNSPSVYGPGGGGTEPARRSTSQGFLGSLAPPAFGAPSPSPSPFLPPPTLLPVFRIRTTVDDKWGFEVTHLFRPWSPSERATARTPSTRPLTHIPPLSSILRTSAGSVDLWSSVSRTAVPLTAGRSPSISGSGRRGGALPRLVDPPPPPSSDASPPRNRGRARAVLDDSTARASPALAAWTMIDSSRPVRPSKSGATTQHTTVAPLVVMPARRLWMSVRRKARSNAVSTGSRPPSAEIAPASSFAPPPGAFLGESTRLRLDGDLLPSFSGVPPPRSAFVASPPPPRTTWHHSSATFRARWSSR
mmetsp:Transcript_20341/g.47780  ORF Transcript_20341/g.47780 Transcript_20341/m.47780 type:complete len:379 (-) Transcript_20341:402-1538(-)